jgi:hypothetical protein
VGPSSLSSDPVGAPGDVAADGGATDGVAAGGADDRESAGAGGEKATSSSATIVAMVSRGSA